MAEKTDTEGSKTTNGEAPSSPAPDATAAAAAQTTTPAAAPPAAPPAPPAAPASEAKPAAEEDKPEPGWRKKERRRGQEQLAKDLGYSSVEEMLAAIPQPGKKKPEETPAEEPEKPKADAKRAEEAAEKKAKAEREEREAEVKRTAEDERRKRLSAERRARQAERDRDAVSARSQLERAARDVGIEETDTAIYHLKLHLHENPVGKGESFDATQFFKGLAESKPWLRGTKKYTVQTAPGENAKPADAAEVAKKTAENSRFDARTATPEELRKRYGPMGIKVPM